MSAPDPHWSSYIGMVTGAIGLVLGIANWRRLSSFKRLDLRLQLRTMLAELDELLAGLPALIDKANTSRVANASAAGRSQSGFMEKWAAEIVENRDQAKNLHEQVAVLEASVGQLSEGSLEQRIIEVRRLLIRANALRDKYQSSMTQDLTDVRQRIDIINRIPR